MDRFGEIKKEWQQAKNEGCNAFTLWKKDMDLIMSEIERLKKEKEWLIKLLLSDYRTYSVGELKEIIIEKMPRALKERE